MFFSFHFLMATASLGKVTSRGDVERSYSIQSFRRAGLLDTVKRKLTAYHYRRLVGRRGKKRALVAVSHALLITIYHMLNRGKAHQNLGADYHERMDSKRLTRYYSRRLEKLGFNVSLLPKKEAA